MHNTTISQQSSEYGAVLTPEEAAEIMKLEVSDIEALITEGQLKASSICGKLRISATAIEEFFAKTFEKPLDITPASELICNTTKNEGDDNLVASVSMSKIKADGRYLVQVDKGYDPATGKRNRESKTFRSEDKAKVYAEILKLKYADVPATSEFKPKANMRYIDYLNWFYSRDKFEISDVTKRSYFDCCRMIRTQLEGMNKLNITLENMNDDVAVKILRLLAKAKKSQSLIDKVRIVMKKSIREAFVKGVLSGNDYTPLIETVKTEADSAERMPYTKQELDMLLGYAKNHSSLYPILCVFKSTGMRPEEIRCLKKENLNWNKKTIHIEHAVIKKYDNLDINSRGSAKEEIGNTKSKYGVRTLPLSDEAMNALKEWQSQVEKHPIGKDSKYIFFGKDGEFMTESQLSNRWKRFLQKYELNKKGIILYRFRHTYCTNLILSGYSLSKIQRLMGDNSMDVINKIYTHLKTDEIAEDEEIRGIINS